MNASLIDRQIIIYTVDDIDLAEKFYENYSYSDQKENKENFEAQRILTNNGYIYSPFLSTNCHRETERFLKNAKEDIFIVSFVRPLPGTGFGGFYDYYEEYKCKKSLYTTLYRFNTDKNNNSNISNTGFYSLIKNYERGNDAIESKENKYNEWINFSKLYLLKASGKMYQDFKYTSKNIMPLIKDRLVSIFKYNENGEFECTKFRFFFPIIFQLENPREKINVGLKENS